MSFGGRPQPAPKVPGTVIEGSTLLWRPCGDLRVGTACCLPLRVLFVVIIYDVSSAIRFPILLYIRFWSVVSPSSPS